jgi:hypothetical protein
MGFVFYKRIRLTKGTGINVSKSGLSTSFRGKYGSFGSNGFSVRTSIPGLSFRKSWMGASKGKGLETLLFLLLIGLAVYVVYNLIVLVGLIAYNILVFVGGFFEGIYRFIRVKMIENKLEKDLSRFAGDPSRLFIKFSTENYKDKLNGEPVYFEQAVAKSNEFVAEGDSVCTIRLLGISADLKSSHNGYVNWYKLPGQELVDGEYFCSIEIPDVENIGNKSETDVTT